MDRLQKPEGFTTFGRRKCDYYKYFNNKHLTPV